MHDEGFCFAFYGRARFLNVTSTSSAQTHAAVGGVRLEHGLRLHPRQRAGGGAAGLRQHLEDNMKAKVYWFSTHDVPGLDRNRQLCRNHDCSAP